MGAHKQFTFQFHLQEHGWADATLHDGENSVSLEASYICDPLSDLARTLVDLYRSPDLERHCAWLVEPGEYRWVFNRREDSVSVEIRWFPDWSEELGNDKGELLFHAASSIKRVATQICDQMKQLKNDVGGEAYRNSWKREFPQEELERLMAEIEAAR